MTTAAHQLENMIEGLLDTQAALMDIRKQAGTEQDLGQVLGVAHSHLLEAEQALFQAYCMTARAQCRIAHAPSPTAT